MYLPVVTMAGKTDQSHNGNKRTRFCWGRFVKSILIVMEFLAADVYWYTAVSRGVLREEYQVFFKIMI